MMTTTIPSSYKHDERDGATTATAITAVLPDLRMHLPIHPRPAERTPRLMQT